MVRRKIDNKCHVKCRPGQIIGPTGRCIKKPKKPTSNVGSGGSGSGVFGGSGSSGSGSGGSGSGGSGSGGSGGFGGSGGVTSRGFVGSGSGGSGSGGSGAAMSRFFTLPTSKSSSSSDADDSAVKIWAATGDPFPATPSGYIPPPGLPKGLDISAHSRSSADRSSSTSWPGLPSHLKIKPGPGAHPTLRAYDLRTGLFLGA